MSTKDRRLIPLPDGIESIRRDLVEYWNRIAFIDALGGVAGSLVHETSAQVTELLETGDPADVYEASRLTAKFDVIRRNES